LAKENKGYRIQYIKAFTEVKYQMLITHSSNGRENSKTEQQDAAINNHSI